MNEKKIKIAAISITLILGYEPILDLYSLASTNDFKRSKPDSLKGQQTLKIRISIIATRLGTDWLILLIKKVQNQ